MINSTNSLTRFIDNLDMADIYVEDNFPLPLTTTFRMQASQAVSFLLGSALVGNKVAGFFHKVPPFETDMPLRAACVFFSCQLPDDIKIPLFFCKTPDQLADILPRAVKTSADTSMPVQVVLSANALNNYVDKDIPYDAQDRVLPYLSASTLPWQPAQKEDKIKAAYTYITQALPPKQGEAAVSLKLPGAWFPEYILPVERTAQSTQMTGITAVKTTEEELPFVYTWVRNFLGLDTKITAELEPEKPLAKTALCPGCPFMALYACADISAYTVFTSVNCPAVREIYGVIHIAYAEFLGMVSKKINIQPLFVSMASQTPEPDPEQLKNGTVLILQDTSAKPVLPPVNSISKFKQIKNSTLPYGCTNIKKALLPRLNPKKCTCIKQGIVPVCKEKNHCPALYEGEEMIQINKTLCSGCRVCVSSCPTKALS